MAHCSVYVDIMKVVRPERWTSLQYTYIIKIKNCVKITGFVNSKDSFIDQPKIINPASELLVKLFDEKGKHTRAAVSVNSLPLGAAVEIDAIFEIE